MGTVLALVLSGLASAAALFLVASGLSLIFGVTRIVNFAHGSFFMLGAYVALSMTRILGSGPLGFWASMVLAAVIVAALGLVIERLLLRRLYNAPHLLPLVATFGLVLVIQEATLWIWGPEDQLGPRAPGLRGAVEILGAPVPRYDLVLIAAALVVFGCLWLLLHRTRWGILVRAAAADREMALALGVNPDRLYASVFALGVGLAALGGALQLPKGGADLLMDLNIIAEAFVVVVVGGMGSIVGAFTAAVLIAQFQTVAVLIVPQATLAVTFLVMAVVLIVRPQGLFGSPLDSASHHVERTPLPETGGWNRALLAAIVLALTLAPLALDTFGLVLLIDGLIMALLATALFTVVGPGGLTSFGHAAFFGAGAYTAALMVLNLGAPMLVTVLAGPVVAGALAFVVGAFAVRLGGVYFAMLTLAFAQLLWSVSVQWISLTGGDNGLLGVWPTGWASDRQAFYYLILVCVLAGIASLRFGLRTPLGVALRASRDSPRRAIAIGIDVAAVQRVAFAVSGAFAGLAGVLYAFSKGSVFPEEMAIARSFDALIMVFFGGVQSLDGAWLGAATLTWLRDALSRVEHWRLGLGLCVMVLVVTFPGGLAGLLAWLGRRIRR